MEIARNLVQGGARNPGTVNYAWVASWNAALYWIQAPAFSVLAYRGENPIDDAMQMQLLDAFSRNSKKKLVAIVNETEISAFCFFGGVPSNVQLATLDFAAMDITRNHLF